MRYHTLRCLSSFILFSRRQFDLIVVVIIEVPNLSTRELELPQELGGLVQREVTLVNVSTGVLRHTILVLIIKHEIDIHIEHRRQLDALLDIVLDSLVLQVDPPLLVTALLNAVAVCGHSLDAKHLVLAVAARRCGPVGSGLSVVLVAPVV